MIPAVAHRIRYANSTELHRQRLRLLFPLRFRRWQSLLCDGYQLTQPISVLNFFLDQEKQLRTLVSGRFNDITYECSPGVSRFDEQLIITDKGYHFSL